MMMLSFETWRSTFKVKTPQWKSCNRNSSAWFEICSPNVAIRQILIGQWQLTSNLVIRKDFRQNQDGISLAEVCALWVLYSLTLCWVTTLSTRLTVECSKWSVNVENLALGLTRRRHDSCQIASVRCLSLIGRLAGAVTETERKLKKAWLAYWSYNWDNDVTTLRSSLYRR